MDGLQSWLAMGGYAPFVWPSFGLSALVLGGLALASVRALRRTERALAVLERDLPPRPGRAAGGAS